MSHWCEHIKKIEYGKSSSVQGHYWGYYASPNSYPSNICKNWISCPICGTPRPVELKKLKDVIYRSFHNSDRYHPEIWCDVSESVKSHIIEVVKTQLDEGGIFHGLFRDKLIKAIEEC